MVTVTDNLLTTIAICAGIGVSLLFLIAMGVWGILLFGVKRRDGD